MSNRTTRFQSESARNKSNVQSSPTSAENEESLVIPMATRHGKKLEVNTKTKNLDVNINQPVDNVTTESKKVPIGKSVHLKRGRNVILDSDSTNSPSPAKRRLAVVPDSDLTDCSPMIRTTNPPKKPIGRSHKVPESESADSTPKN